MNHFILRVDESVDEEHRRNRTRKCVKRCEEDDGLLQQGREKGVSPRKEEEEGYASASWNPLGDVRSTSEAKIISRTSLVHVVR